MLCECLHGDITIRTRTQRERERERERDRHAPVLSLSVSRRNVREEGHARSFCSRKEGRIWTMETGGRGRRAGRRGYRTNERASERGDPPQSWLLARPLAFWPSFRLQSCSSGIQPRKERERERPFLPSFFLHLAPLGLTLLPRKKRRATKGDWSGGSGVVWTAWYGGGGESQPERGRERRKEREREERGPSERPIH